MVEATIVKCHLRYYRRQGLTQVLQHFELLGRELIVVGKRSHGPAKADAEEGLQSGKKIGRWTLREAEESPRNPQVVLAELDP